MNNNRFKLRAWLKNYSKMVDVKQITDMGSTAYIKFYKWDKKLNTPTFENLEDVILMQCTGVGDISNNLIYEGDLIQHYCEADDSLRLLRVEYDEDRCGFDLYQNLTNDPIFGYIDDFSCSYELRKELGTIEISGNIYDNPELIKHDEDQY